MSSPRPVIEVRFGVVTDVRERVALSLPNKVADCKLEEMVGRGILGRVNHFDFTLTLK